MFCSGVPAFAGREEGLASVRLKEGRIIQTGKGRSCSENLSNFISVFLSTVAAFRACKKDNKFPDLLRKMDKEETLLESGSVSLTKQEKCFGELNF